VTSRLWGIEVKRGNRLDNRFDLELIPGLSWEIRPSFLAFLRSQFSGGRGGCRLRLLLQEVHGVDGRGEPSPGCGEAKGKQLEKKSEEASRRQKEAGPGQEQGEGGGGERGEREK